MGEVYRLTFSNGKSYIGLSTQSAEIRYRSHAYAAKKGKIQDPVYRAWRKYGAPTLEVITRGLSEEELVAAEIAAIAAHGTLTPNGYNVSPGGTHPPSVRPEVAARIGLKVRRQWQDPATREKMVAGMQGKTRSEEARQRMSKSRMGTKHTLATKVLVSTKLTGIKRSEETRRRMSEAAKIRGVSQKTRDAQRKRRTGRPLSEATKAKMRLAQASRRVRERTAAFVKGEEAVV